ncbi:MULTISPECIES: ribosomal protein S18-alanine N-acetyltransferase [Pseudovibrio]|uniref:ribosomal protein S18-alanine N-acetyltransferase n=1 Tax=Stappiaceae TaxID=2821832 RepID=UPI0023656900|nr:MULTISPECIES: ribosomal protein S18-alanine N-acetyltransferase [Pseudovibrio]MDD7909671.1 ribosomal protein S18-alanine N-acetyltransferase [Pseudovibrio exalbescens]MDX5592013.1 ribosomal protein S18-alanine N-acetyltransferase [Pseudovibrio sp. SPO723]
MSLEWFKAPPPIIRKTTLQDLRSLADIHAQCFQPGWGRAELASLYEQKGVVFFTATPSGAFERRDPIGFLALRIVADEAEVLTIAVSPKYQGKGVGRKLMEDGLFHLYSERVEMLFLEVDDTNVSAVSLYKKLGFRQVGERKGYYSNSEGSGTALVMRCDLR